MTPEGRVKKNIDRILASFPSVYSFMPVQMGMGASGVDYHCVVGRLFALKTGIEKVGVAFFIEAKRPHEVPTSRQEEFLSNRRKQGCKTFVIDEDPSIEAGSGIH